MPVDSLDMTKKYDFFMIMLNSMGEGPSYIVAIDLIPSENC